MARTKGAMKLKQAIEYSGKSPLDARALVKTVADLTDSKSYTKTAVYVGMIVSVQETGEVYVLKDTDFTQTTSWANIASGAEPQNNIVRTNDVDSLPATGEEGKVYVVKSGTTGGETPADTYDVYIWQAADEENEVPAKYIKVTEGYTKNSEVAAATDEEIDALCTEIFG